MKYGLIGTNLAHSKSKEMHANLPYQYYQIAQDSLSNFVIKARKEMINFNITFPFKEEIIPYLDKLSLSVIKTGACNCVANENGVLVGYNTDYLALVKIFNNLDLKDKKVLLIGYGGAGKAVYHALKNFECQVSITNRNMDKLEGLNSIEFTNFEEKIIDFDVIINATNAEQNGDAVFKKFNSKKDALFFDLIYNPEVTPFLQTAKDNGSKIMNGLEMLSFQAQIAQQKWNGEKKIAIFGGSFNPPHKIHSQIIFHLEEKFDFDEIWLMPTPFSPFKSELSNITKEKHLALLNEYVKYTNSILKLDDYKESIAYTSELLKSLTKQFPQSKFSLIIGGDNVDSFAKWHEYEYILDNFEVIGFARKNYFNFHDKIKIVNYINSSISSSLFRQTLDETILDEWTCKYLKEHDLYGLKNNC